MAIGYSVSKQHALTALEPLRFSADGRFKILHISDIHKVHPDMDDDPDRTVPEAKSLNTLNTLSEAIKRTQPDLVVFGGDNIGGHWDEMTDEYVLWCIDSNDYAHGPDGAQITHDENRVFDSQLQWYEATVNAEKEKFGRTVPAVLFQHIPVVQVFDFIEECDESICDYQHKGKFYRAKDGAIKSGQLREKPCPSYGSRAEFETWKRCGDIKAAFFGHDHINSFCFEKDGIELYQTIGCGYETYGREHGGRLITLFKDGSYETETVVIEKKY